MPSGLCNRSSIFQQSIQVVLAGLEWQCYFVYIAWWYPPILSQNTWIIYSKPLMDFAKLISSWNLRNVVSFKKRYTILKHGVAPEAAKVNQYPCPKDITQIWQFLGLASYYRRFIPNFAKIVSPLYALTKKGAEFCWSQVCQGAFNLLSLFSLHYLLGHHCVLLHRPFGLHITT